MSEKSLIFERLFLYSAYIIHAQRDPSSFFFFFLLKQKTEKTSLVQCLSFSGAFVNETRIVETFVFI